ncbi:glycosyltransferase family 2 protein [Aquihabitans sp. McL0605]|uniref:glycosyltransferase family 2 protein n=1 Tax=Aquihabitans sp. McL0605 TaxID=3415671 RepID=UPI003CE9D949
MTGPFTFAVVGRDEEATLPTALGVAMEAAEPGDRVWFVDSGSTDASAAIAARLGVEVVAAPEGKGRAMQAAFDRCHEGHLVFLDADYEWSEVNIAAALRAEAVRTGADMVVGTYDEAGRRRVVMPGVYHPLVGALAPEALEHIDIALSGFRAVRPSVLRSPLPPGYGAETHLNLEATFGGDHVVSCPVGGFRGSLREYRNIPAILDDVAAAILDAAVRHGRLDAAARPVWDAWIDPVRALVTDQPAPGADDAAFVAHLGALAGRPLPDALAATC